MTKKELLKILEPFEDNTLIILSDSVGTYYKKADDFDHKRYHEGEVGIPELTDELIKEGYTEEDTLPEGQDCIVLWSE